jgi:NADH:ubiquinone oxidoreductase subunit
MAKKKMRRMRRAWSKDDIRELKAHSKAKTPVIKIARLTKRTAEALRQKAWQLEIPLGHRR